MRTFPLLLKLIVMVFAVTLVASAPAMADQTFSTGAGASVGDGPVSAQATFSFSGNTLTVTLTDLLANPTSVGQLISDLFFTIDGATGVSLTGSSAQEITINSDNSSTLGGTVSTGWILNTNSSTFQLCVICAQNQPNPPAPSHLIIGPGPYTNANGSIAENGPQTPHNPFLNQTATFTLTGDFGTNPTISNVLFSFGTSPGVEVPGTPGSSVPEPASVVMLGSGLLGLAGLVRRRMKI
jgi:hypothetical protein